MAQQLIQSFYDAINNRDMNKFLSFFSDNGQFKAVASDETYNGKNEIRQMAEKWMKTFSDGKFQVQKIIGSGDDWSAELSFVGTHDGTLSVPMGDIPASGKKVDVPVCDVLNLKNGKIQSLHCYFAATVLLNQIGAMPARKAA